PLLFIIIYIFQIVAFQSKEGLLDFGIIAIRIGGLLSGIVLIIGISMVYFFRTNKGILQIISGKGKNEEGKMIDPEEPTLEELGMNTNINVDYYLNHRCAVKLTRSADHYSASIIRSVYRQHHSNALFIELTSLIVIVLFSFLIDYSFFRIPAGASILLLFTILMMLMGAFTYWLGQWKVFFFVVLIIFVDLLIQSNLLQYKNKAYGLSYEPKAIYTYELLQQLTDTGYVNEDRKKTLAILNTWKNKFDPAQPKPKMIFLNCSGGGLRATMFVMKVLQEADSATQHKLMQHCPLITGASGGMIAAAYYRELYYRKLNGEQLDIDDEKYLKNISGDLLNAVGFTFVVNDLFYPWQSFEVGDTKFRKDRGYMFEKILNENTDYVLDKTLSDYKLAEQQMQIPMMLFYPTILNDERKLFIGAQGFSYLTIPGRRLQDFSKPEIDGVDYHKLFENNTADSISFTSVLRMNCTFPYILPNVHLPTEPDIEVMDAGIRDNYGVQVSARFMEEFKDWINENTSGVIVINIRGIEQNMGISENVTQGVLEKIFSPIGTLYNNWVEIRDYQNDNILNSLDALLNNKMEVITFEYVPLEKDARASLSFHLTAREKRDILNAANNSYNNAACKELERLLK
ncbi:MAG: patatin-like phospholipase family protein, partial [Fimbriimonadaceae bacterium]|nr:patatin-like phospholipase family protein [Chitinophagales bacterium]